MKFFPITCCLLTWVSPLAAADANAPVGEARVYKTVAGRDLNLYIARPDGWKATDRRPAIVFFHGGGWVGGKPNQFNEHSTYFAGRGRVCIQVEYRLGDRVLGAGPHLQLEAMDLLVHIQSPWIGAHAE